MPFVAASDLQFKGVSGGRQGAKVRGEQLQLNYLKFEAGTGAHTHVHPEEQIVYVIRGRFRIDSGGEEREVGPGEIVMHGANVPHTVSALEDGELISLKAVFGEGPREGTPAG